MSNIKCLTCESNNIETSGSGALPIYTCRDCKNMMWPSTRPSLDDIKRANDEISIGDFTLTASYANESDKIGIYRSSGEGGVFSREELAKVIEIFYKERL